MPEPEFIEQGGLNGPGPCHAVKRRIALHVAKISGWIIGYPGLARDTPVMLLRHHEVHLLAVVDLIVEPQCVVVPIGVGALAGGAVYSVLGLMPREARRIQAVAHRIVVG